MESRRMEIKKYFSEIEGLVSDLDCHILQEYARDKVCLEIGSWRGKSSVALAEVAKEVFCIDTFKGGDNKHNDQKQMENITTFDSFMINIKGYNNIHVWIGESYKILTSGYDFSCDLAFIDGCHEYESVYFDIKQCWKLLKPNGYLFVHDYGIKAHPGVQKAFDELLGIYDGRRKYLAWKRKID